MSVPSGASLARRSQAAVAVDGRAAALSHCERVPRGPVVAPLKPCHADPDSTGQICCSARGSRPPANSETSALAAGDASAGEPSTERYAC
jgi:hypothetical protein